MTDRNFLTLIYSADVPMRPFGKARPRVTRNGTYMPKEYTDKKDELKLRWRNWRTK